VGFSSSNMSPGSTYIRIRLVKRYYARGKAQIVEKVLALASFLEKVIHVKFPNALLTWILYMVRIELTLESH
jgi:hypothetical protein